MEPGRARITGRVARRRIAAGSKSDRVGVVLEDAAGRIYALRRAGGHPFSDAVLDGLVGKTITGNGVVSGRSFIMDDWSIDLPQAKG
jgi:hypothetical protein